jgi:hypothetical protein
VLINGALIGSFAVVDGQTGPVHLDFSFAPITGPNYTVRFEVTNEVPDGYGAHTLGYAGIHAGNVQLLGDIPREPVFRYSVRLPKHAWFLQEDVNNIYWFSVVAVYNAGTDPLYDWGWTNHPHFFNDDAVAGTFDPEVGWSWQELYDQTEQSEDMSFILFTRPECTLYGHPDYLEWLSVGKPDCWCYTRQCHGDADNLPYGKSNYWTSIPDLEVLKAAWNKNLATILGKKVIDFNPSCTSSCNVPLICADFDHKPYGKSNYRISIPDLAILKANWNVPNKPDPNCFD